MRTSIMKSVLVLALASSSSIAFAQATAETDNGGLEEIIVTATKRAENLQDVPVAISAISASALQNAGVFETSDLNHAIPNLQVSSPYGEAQPNFSLRGVGVGTEFNANAASPVGVYVDEVYQAFRASHGQQLYDLNQIEVLRGPQGTLFGRNTTGGAINFITRAPELKGSNGYLTLGYGNYNRFNVQGAVEFTGAEDKFGIRVAGTYVNSDPFVRNRLAAGVNRSAAGGASGLNLNTGKDYGGYESYGFRGTIRVKPSDSIDLSLKGYIAKSKGGTEGPIATGQSKTTDVINYRSPNFLLNGIFNALAPALLPGSYSASANGLDDQEIQADTVGTAITEANGVVFNAKIELSDHLKLTSITGYDDGRYLQSPTECDGTPLRLCAITYDSKFNAFNQDVRLDFSSGPVKIIVGGYYGKDSVTANNKPDFFNFLRDVNAAVGSPSGYFNPGGAFNGTALSAGSLPTGVTALQHFKQVRKSYAFYGEGSYQIAETVKLTLGARYTSDKNIFSEGNTTYFDDLGTARLVTVSNFRQGGAFAPYFLQAVRNEAGAVVIPSFQGLGIPLPGALEQRGSSNKLSGRAIIDWKPSESSLIYASYSRGYRAGTFNGLAYGSANQVYFVAPEQVNAYEIGFKTRFADNRVQINGSFFYYDYKGQQGQVVDATATANLISLNGTLKGLEIDAQFKATDRLRLSASFGLLDTKYAGGACPANAASIPSFPSQLGSCVVSGGGPVSVAGNPFPYAAKSTGNVSFDWDAFDIGSGKLTLHGDAAYTGRFYYDSFKDYSRGPLVNLSTGRFADGEGNDWNLNSRLTYSTDRFSVAAWVKNITDKTTYPFGIAIENLFGNGYRPRAQPRTFGVEGTVKF
jgi:iron complex outermembrane recepter protein